MHRRIIDNLRECVWVVPVVVLIVALILLCRGCQ